MKNKGFTLIELLAVIVILAVVSLIAIPLIMNVIETSKKGAIKDSAYGIINASETYLANNLKTGLESNIKFTCSNNKCVSDDNKEINFKGKVENGTLIISANSKVLVCVDDGEYYALKLENEEKVTNGEGTCGAYEEANGTFAIISDIDALKAEYEAKIKKLEEENEQTIEALKEEYEEEITNLQEEVTNKQVSISNSSSWKAPKDGKVICVFGHVTGASGNSPGTYYQYVWDATTGVYYLSRSGSRGCSMLDYVSFDAVAGHTYNWSFYRSGGDYPSTSLASAYFIYTS